jgi:hypothetical protein
MNFTSNLILAICLTFYPGAPGHSLYIKPSVYLMPREVFTNQANWDRVKSGNGIKVYSQWVTLYDGWKSRRLRGGFQVNMPLPDLLVFLKNGGKTKSRDEVVSSCYHVKMEDNTRYSHTKFKTPRPFTGRPGEVLCTADRISHPGIY